MMRGISKLAGTLTVIAVMACSLAAQHAQKPLTNDGVIKMVKAKLSESVVVATIQSSPANYDISPDGLIALQKAGVTQNEMDAIVAAQKAANTGGAVADWRMLMPRARVRRPLLSRGPSGRCRR